MWLLSTYQGIFSQTLSKHRASHMCDYCTVVNVSAVESKCFRYCKYFKCCTISGSFGWAAIVKNIANFWHKCRRRAILQKAWKTKELLVLWYLVPANFRQSKSAVWLAQSILLLEIEISRYSYVFKKK